ncbi:MAG: PAS-domain containing protein [Pseudomonadota bacterium]
MSAGRSRSAKPLGRCRQRLASTVILLPSVVWPAPTFAQIANRTEPYPTFAEPSLFSTLGPLEITLGAGLVGAVVFAAVSGIGLMRTHLRTAAEGAALRGEVQRLRGEMDLTEALLTSDDQRQVVWPSPGKTPMLYGALPTEADAPRADAAFLAFGNWLDARSALQLEGCIADLRENGAPFRQNLKTKSGAFLECSGRLAGGKPAVRFRDLTGERESLARLNEAHERQKNDLRATQALLEAAPGPSWIRARNGRILWVNAAYVQAVGLADREEVLREGTELLDGAARAAVAKGHGQGPVFTGRQPVTVNGRRRIFDLIDVETEDGSCGLAIDMTELADAHGELTRAVASHERILNQMQSAVAIFGPDHRLRFHNEAYRDLWSLDPAFLNGTPLDSDVLDALRQQRQLPEQADFRQWKADLLAGYRENDGIEDRWHLPDGRIIRVVVTPNPQGGVTHLFENITERMNLESRLNALAQVQGETLDNLSEGVAVFGSDGRLALWNPTFLRLWALDEDILVAKPHVSDVIDVCKARHDDDADWNAILKAVAGLDDARHLSAKQMSRSDGTILSHAIVPLPDGGTMVTFADVTASVNVERALREKADALEEAHDIKNTFLQHVSYEMRSPLTNIIGFAQLLSEPRTGDLTPKQREYADYILSSSSALLVIINDVLDLATVDAGIMELDVTEIDIEKTLGAVTEALQDRLSESGIDLQTSVGSSLKGFMADEKRLRQILFNLITNGIRFSDSGSTVSVSCKRNEDRVVFIVADNGHGIARDVIDSVFGRFVSHGTQTRRRGAGLGLSIVKSFVELHGGTVDINSESGVGTQVRCFFPLRPVPTDVAAE